MEVDGANLDVLIVRLTAAEAPLCGARSSSAAVPNDQRDP